MAALPYIQLYVADYLADTMHLTTEEHGAYLLLIMNYWQTGHAIPKKRLASVARMSNERWADVENSLNEFFTETPTGDWFHARIEGDLFKVKGKSESASAAGKASAAKRAASKPRMNTDNSNERSTNVADPLQRKANHTDTDKDKDKDKEVNPLPDKPARVPTKKTVFNKPEDVSELVWNDFLIVRKAKNSPITESSISGIRREAGKVNISFEDALIVCIERNWQAFKSEWHNPEKTPSGGSEIFRGVL